MRVVLDTNVLADVRVSLPGAFVEEYLRNPGRPDPLQLPADERAALAGRLIESLDGEIEEAWSVEMQRRLRRLDAGVAGTGPWAEARRRILAAAGRGAGR